MLFMNIRHYKGLGAVFAAAAAFVIGSPASAQSSPACQSSEYRQLDFLLGNWDIYDMPGDKAPTTRARIDAVLDHCAIQIRTEGVKGNNGQNLTAYDAARKLWHQTWTTNQGRLLMLEGNLNNGRMVLTGHAVHGDNASPLIRFSLWAENGEGRELGEISKDGGKTWNKTFDLLFRPAK